MSSLRKPSAGPLVAMGVILALLIGVCAKYFWGLFRWTIQSPPHPPGYDRLVAAIETHDPKEVEAVLNSGVNPNVYPDTQADLEAEDDINAMSIAVGEGNIDIVRVMLDHGADPSEGDGFNDDPLSAACEDERLDIMQLLLSRGAKINNDELNSYALWRAAMDGKVQATHFLLNHGANPKTSLSGYLVDALKSTGGSPEIIRIIEDRIRAEKSKPGFQNPPSVVLVPPTGH